MPIDAYSFVEYPSRQAQLISVYVGIGQSSVVRCESIQLIAMPV